MLDNLELVDFVKNKEAMQAYREWLANPVTQRMHFFCQRASRALGLAPGERTGENALYLAGVSVGSQAITDFLSGLDVIARAMQDVKDVPADFGMREIMQSWGYIDKPKQEKPNAG